MERKYYYIVLTMLLVAIPIVSSPDFDGTLSVFRVEPLQRDLIRFLLIIIFFYLNLFVLLPKLLGKGKYIIFTICFLLYFLLVTFVPFLLIPNTQHFIENLPPKEAVNSLPPYLKNNKIPVGGKDDAFPKKLFSSLLPFLFSFLSSLFIYKQDEERKLREDKAKAELLNLKVQLQPHFLFNILNSIYSLVLIKSDDAPNGILKLSNVMRYMLKEGAEDDVLLRKELDYVKDYIDLQLIRTDNSLNFSYVEIGDCKQLKIAPFILINFVENAFKYGYNAEENSKIKVEAIIQENTLNFKVANKIVNKKQEGESLKIGLRNAIERLKKIYPKTHTLAINDNGEIFDVDLKIEL